MSRTFYIFLGGAYGDVYWTQKTSPTEDQWESWSSGELVIILVVGKSAFKRTNYYEKNNEPEWEQLKEIVS